MIRGLGIQLWNIYVCIYIHAYIYNQIEFTLGCIPNPFLSSLLCGFYCLTIRGCHSISRHCIHISGKTNEWEWAVECMAYYRSTSQINMLSFKLRRKKIFYFYPRSICLTIFAYTKNYRRDLASSLEFSLKILLFNLI